MNTENSQTKQQEVKQQGAKQPKQKKQRCAICRKNLKTMVFTCQCKNIFCIQHQSAHSHACPCISQKKDIHRQEIKHKNPPVVPTTLEVL